MNPTNKMRPIHAGEILREEFLVAANDDVALMAHAVILIIKERFCV